MRRGRDRKLWKDGSKDEFRIQNSGGAWGPGHAQQSKSQIHLSIHSPRQEPAAHPSSLATGIIIVFMLRYATSPGGPSFFLSFSPPPVPLCPSAILAHFAWPDGRPRAVLWHPSALLARFQVNQRQIQGRAQPNFGPPWKPWPGPRFYSSRNGRPLTIGLSASDGSS